jgi:8-oxo-dGTP diphosphatase
MPPCENRPPVPERGVAIVILQGDQFLVIRRSMQVRAPGTYCFPGGLIEAGETEEQAVIREMVEELGSPAAPVRRLWRSVTPWGVELAWWLAELAPDSVLAANPAEVDSWHWHTTDEMLALSDLLESNRAFLGALRRGDISLC